MIHQLSSTLTSTHQGCLPLLIHHTDPIQTIESFSCYVQQKKNDIIINKQAKVNERHDKILFQTVNALRSKIASIEKEIIGEGVIKNKLLEIKEKKINYENLQHKYMINERVKSK